MAENETEFSAFKAARTANDEAGAIAAVAEVDATEQIPFEPEGSDRGENEIEKELRERADAAKPKNEEEAEPEQKLEEKPEEKPEKKLEEKPKSSKDKRFDKLTAQKHAAQTEAEQARAEAADLRARIEALEKQGKPPDRESTKEEVKAAGREEHIAELRKVDKDYDTVVKAIETLPQTVRDAVKEVGNPARVEYFLAKFPDARKDLEGRTPETQRAIIRDISESLNTFHDTYKQTAATPQVEHARKIEAAAMKLENSADIAGVLQQNPEYGAHLMSLKPEEAVAQVQNLGAHLQVLRPIVEAIKGEENADEILKHFQAHPEVFEKITKLPSAEARRREVIRLAATLPFSSEAPREKSRSRAPEPIKPLSTSPSRSEPEGREDMSLSDYNKWRNAGGGR